MTFSTSDVAACCSSASSRSRVSRVSSSVENRLGWGLETLRPFRFNPLVLLSQKVAAFADEESSIWQT